MASITTYCDASWIATARHATQHQSIPFRKAASKVWPSAELRQISARVSFQHHSSSPATPLQMLHQRLRLRRPPKILPIRRGANRSKERQNRGTGTPASPRPQRASALALFAKKSDCRERGAGRTFERWPVTAGLSCCRRELLRIALRAHAAAAPRRKRCERWLEAGGRAIARAAARRESRTDHDTRRFRRLK